jgi:hypothetical protein
MSKQRSVASHYPPVSPVQLPQIYDLWTRYHTGVISLQCVEQNTTSNQHNIVCNKIRHSVSVNRESRGTLYE